MNKALKVTLCRLSYYYLQYYVGLSKDSKSILATLRGDPVAYGDPIASDNGVFEPMDLDWETIEEDTREDDTYAFRDLSEFR